MDGDGGMPNDDPNQPLWRRPSNGVDRFKPQGALRQQKRKRTRKPQAASGQARVGFATASARKTAPRDFDSDDYSDSGEDTRDMNADELAARGFPQVVPAPAGQAQAAPDPAAQAQAAPPLPHKRRPRPRLSRRRPPPPRPLRNRP